MSNTFDAIIVTTAKDYLRVHSNYKRILDLLPSKKIVFVGNDEVGKLVAGEEWADRAGFINENDVLPFDKVNDVMKQLLHTENVPRSVTGWYYQQFLKMKYADFSENPYYLVWDGDTVPTKAFSMFDATDTYPYFDMKYEYHEEYFITLEKLFPGMKKVLGKSFIAEHMIFSVSIMREMIERIEANASLGDGPFYEKILRAIRPGELTSNSFSEFETYGTYVAFNHPDVYRLKDWHSIRYGSIYFIPEQLTEEDYLWISKDFDAVSFEKNMDYNPDIAALFTNKEYRSKLSARQIIEAIQDSSEGMREEWEDSAPSDASTSQASGETASAVLNEPDEEIVPDTSTDDEFLLFNYLGDNLSGTNPNQAFLCYENAEFLCPDENIKAVLKEKKETLKASGKVSVSKTSIAIVSYNASYLMKQCLYSIRKYCAPGSYEVVVADNASTDGITDWLSRQDDIVLIKNEENLGFPKGCNVAIAHAAKENDILLLNNDTRMTHNALFWLRMGLYESEHVGAAGSVANYCGIDQLEDVSFGLPGEYVDYGAKVNVLMKQPYEEKNKLGGFAMLMKRKAFDEIGHLEEAFTPGFFEDDDISTGIHVRGYRLLVCHNSFIYHAGSQSFSQRTDLSEIFERNHEKMTEKWGYDTLTYSVVTKQEAATVEYITHGRDDFFRILEVGAGSGNMISRLKYLYKNAAVYGVESNETVVRNAIETIPLLYADWKTDKLPFVDGFFDYIIVNGRDSAEYDMDLIKTKLGRYVKDISQIICVKN